MTKSSHSFEGQPHIDQWSIERLLLGRPAGPAAGPATEAISELIDAARAPATSAELAGEATVLAAFADTARSRHPAASRSQSRRSPMLAMKTRLGSKLAVAAAFGAVSVGLTAAAYAGSLPDPAQALAHKSIGAPAAHSDHPVSTPQGPDATGKAAHGLCTAFDKAKAHGNAKAKSVAYRNLVIAAGGESNIGAYCAAARHPGKSPSAHPSGKPDTHPSGPPASHPAGSHAPHPSGPPTSHPAAPPVPHPSGPPVTPTPSHG